MPLAAKQLSLTSRFSPIEDHHERLAAIVSHGQRWPEVSSTEQVPAHQIHACLSPVWLTGAFVDSTCHFRLSATSPLVKGLASLLVELYHGESPEDILAFEPSLLSQLHLLHHISPTRLHGLDHIRQTIRNFAKTIITTTHDRRP